MCTNISVHNEYGFTLYVRTLVIIQSCITYQYLFHHQILPHGALFFLRMRYIIKATCLRTPINELKQLWPCEIIRHIFTKS